MSELHPQSPQDAVHAAFGGNRSKDIRSQYLLRTDAVIASLLMVQIRRISGLSARDIAQIMEMPNATLSHVIHGRAGEVVGPDGESTTSRTIKELQMLWHELLYVNQM